MWNSIPRRTAAVFGIIILMYSYGCILSPEEDYNWSSATGRLPIAKRGLGYMMDHPFLGIGLHNFERAEGTISSVAQNAMPGKGVW